MRGCRTYSLPGWTKAGSNPGRPSNPIHFHIDFWGVGSCGRGRNSSRFARVNPEGRFHYNRDRSGDGSKPRFWWSLPKPAGTYRPDQPAEGITFEQSCRHRRTLSFKQRDEAFVR